MLAQPRAAQASPPIIPTTPLISTYSFRSPVRVATRLQPQPGRSAGWPERGWNGEHPFVMLSEAKHLSAHRMRSFADAVWVTILVTLSVSVHRSARASQTRPDEPGAL